MAEKNKPTTLNVEDTEKITDELGKWNSQAYKFVSIIKETDEIQKSVKDNAAEYVRYLKEWQKAQKQINKLATVKKELEDKDKVANAEKIKYIQREISLLEDRNKVIKQALESTSKLSLVGKEVLKGFSKLPDLIQKGYGKLQSSGLFEMDKAIKTSALSMGLLGKGSDAFRGSMKAASMDAAMLGTSFSDLVKIQAEYADELGRNVDLGKSGVLAINEMAKGTNMGLEGATKMAAEFENIGMSAENTRDFVQQTMNDASSMGLNASKVIKNIQNNIKLLNKYNFKNGVKGLEQMALTASKLGVDINTVAPLADKLWNVEGAVEMSAQLQVMGGDFAALADPFKLMYKARNDMKGLTEDFANAAKASMVFGKDGIEMNTLEMSRLKKIAEETGMNYDDLVKMGKNAFKNDAIKKQTSGLDPKQMEYVSNLAKFSENGTATIEIGGSTKLLSQLTAADKTLINQRVLQQADLKKRAEAAMTFDETLKGFVDGLKVDLLPIVEVMDKEMVPALRNFVKKFIDGGWDKKLASFAETIGGLISTIGKFIINNPIISGIAFLSAKITGWFFAQAEWIKNGFALAEGFNMGTAGGGGKSFIGKLMGKLTGRGGTAAAEGAAAEGAAAEGAAGAELATAASTGSKVVANSAKLIGRLGGVVAGLTSAVSEFYSNKDNKSMSTGENLGRSAIKGAGAGLGAWGGAMAGAAIGEAIFPLGGGIPGALIGGALGAFGGNAGGDLVNQGLFGPKVSGINDGVIQFNPNDKFMKVNDSTMVAGTNVNGNKDLANALNGGGIKSPSQSSAISNNLNVNLSELKISGTIELKLGNNVSKEIGDSLIQDPVFVRNISKMINIEMGKIKNIKIS